MSSALRDYRMLIDGEWVDGAGGETFDTVNPFTGRAWATVPRGAATTWTGPCGRRGPPSETGGRGGDPFKLG